MRPPHHLTLLCLVLLTRHAGSQPLQLPKLEAPPPLTQEQQCLLNVAMFKFPEMEANARWGWRKSGTVLVFDAPPNTKLIIADAVRMDLKRRTVFASRDGASYFIIERGGMTDVTHWYGPIAAAEIPAACENEQALSLAQ